jgi:drug/metabolite transporter (DMT)-like permease
MIWGSGVDALAALALDGAPVFPADPAYWAGTVYLALIGSSLAFTLYFGVVRAMGPARAAYSSVLTPALAMLLSTVFEAYRWTPAAALAGVLVLTGLVVALRARAAG